MAGGTGRQDTTPERVHDRRCGWGRFRGGAHQIPFYILQAAWRPMPRGRSAQNAADGRVAQGSPSALLGARLHALRRPDADLRPRSPKSTGLQESVHLVGCRQTLVACRGKGDLLQADRHRTGRGGLQQRAQGVVKRLPAETSQQQPSRVFLSAPGSATQLPGGIVCVSAALHLCSGTSTLWRMPRCPHVVSRRRVQGETRLAGGQSVLAGRDRGLGTRASEQQVVR